MNLKLSDKSQDSWPQRCGGYAGPTNAQREFRSDRSLSDPDVRTARTLLAVSSSLNISVTATEILQRGIPECQNASKALLLASIHSYFTHVPTQWLFHITLVLTDRSYDLDFIPALKSKWNAERGHPGSVLVDCELHIPTSYRCRH